MRRSAPLTSLQQQEQQAAAQPAGAASGPVQSLLQGTRMLGQLSARFLRSSRGNLALNERPLTVDGTPGGERPHDLPPEPPSS
jgi:hypothetical protein